MFLFFKFYIYCMKRLIFIKNDLTEIPVPEIGYVTVGLDLNGELNYIDDQGSISPLGGSGSGSTNLNVGSKTPTTLDIESSNGTNTTVPSVTTSEAGLSSAADKTKLDGIETSADVTDTANVVSALTAGTNITISNDGTIDASSGSTSPLTSKGDLYTNNGTSDVSLALGTNGQALVVDTTEATGLKYVNLSEIPAVGGGLLVDLGFGTTNQVITTSNGATTINFDDTVTGAIDKNGDWNNTSKKFIVSSTSGDGTYQFEVNLFSQNSTGAYYNLQAFINGVLKTPNGAFAMSDAISDSGFDGAAGTISLDLNVGDEVEIKLQAYGSANTTISGSGTWNFAQGMRISKASGIKGEKGDTGTGAPVSLNKTFTLQEPTASDNITMFRTDVDITIQEVVVVHTGTNTPGTTITIRHEPDRSATGNSLTNGSLASSNTTTGVVYTVANGSLSDVTIPADSFVWLVTSAASGDGVYLSIDMRYTED